LLWSPMNMSYEDKLKRCGLTILNRNTSRRDYEPSIEKYHWKRISRPIGQQWERFFEVAPITTTRNKCKINC